jgi:hypothetical protein
MTASTREAAHEVDMQTTEGKGMEGVVHKKITLCEEKDPKLNGGRSIT